MDDVGRCCCVSPRQHSQAATSPHKLNEERFVNGQALSAEYLPNLKELFLAENHVRRMGPNERLSPPPPLCLYRRNFGCCCSCCYHVVGS
jgi:hypothetical protein